MKRTDEKKNQTGYTPKNSGRSTTVAAVEDPPPAPKRAKAKPTNDTSDIVKPKPRRADTLPLISVMSREDMDAARDLMQADVDYQEQLNAIKEIRDNIKSELAVLANRYKLDGFRFATVCTYYGGMKTKKTFDSKRAKQMLVELGATAEDIDALTKESKPYLDLRVLDLNKDSGEGEEE